MAEKIPRVTLYSRSRCNHCKQAKQWLKNRGIHFQEFDIERNPRAAKEFQRLGARGVPVTLVNQQRLDGFNAKQFDATFKKLGV